MHIVTLIRVIAPALNPPGCQDYGACPTGTADSPVIRGTRVIPAVQRSRCARDRTANASVGVLQARLISVRAATNPARITTMMTTLRMPHIPGECSCKGVRTS